MALLACFTASPLIAEDKKAADRPNIVFILSDDQGWNHVSTPMIPDREDTRSHVIRTPNLERLAAQGMTFSSGYAPGSMCMVSRYGIMYGRNPARLIRTVNGPRIERSPALGPLASIAETLKSIDPHYRTAHFGKWHMTAGGVDKGHTPKSAGFDVSDGPTTNEEGNVSPGDDPKRMFSITRKSIAFMTEQYRAGHPFYLQISHYANHQRHRALKTTQQAYAKRPDDPRHGSDIYNAMTENLDTTVGQVIDVIKELGIADNTFVFFMSDNGGRLEKDKNNLPLRGGKSSIWEGGLRTPTYAVGPGIVAGSHSRVPIVGTDLLPTFADLAGDTSILADELDGVSIRGILENKGQGDLDRKFPLVFHFPHTWGDNSPRPWTAIREGDFKLIRYWDGDEELLLFDLSRDLGEKNNLVLEKPEVARALHKKMLEYLASVDAEKAEEGRKR
jgi:arylsulfatase A-like enzyme